MLALSLALLFGVQQTPPQSDLDKAFKEAEASKSGELGSQKLGPVNLRLLDLSLDGLFAVGASNQEEDEIGVLQAGGHDPRKRGFTVQNVELAATAAVDPYFTAQANIVWFIDPIEGETGMELEEAFALTSALPAGLQIKAGQFFTEFGRHNPQHPHQWDFQDQPVIVSRLFGPDGLRGAGTRVGWLMPVPFYSELIAGVQNASGETMTSFFANDEVYSEAAPGGRSFVERQVHTLGDMLYHLRWTMSLDLSPEITAVGGLSALFGPNASAEDGRTRIYGLDVRLKWRPSTNFRGWPFVVWQTEFMLRDFQSESEEIDPDAIPANGDEFRSDDELSDSGFYSYVLWGFEYGWVAGVRIETCSGSKDSIVRDDLGNRVGVTDGTDPFHDSRTRLSLMLAWHPTEFSRLRLQYNFDKADHLDDLDDETGHSIWFGFEFMFGAHAAHAY
jgi:hypothetical protein